MTQLALTDASLTALFEQVRTIALVGASNKPDRASYGVMEFLQQHGFKVIPINPVVEGEILGEPVYQSLTDAVDAGHRFDMVDIFRKSEAVQAIVEEAITLGKSAIWMQLGVINQPARQLAEDAGCLVVMDLCTKIELRRLRNL